MAKIVKGYTGEYGVLALLEITDIPNYFQNRGVSKTLIIPVSIVSSLGFVLRNPVPLERVSPKVMAKAIRSSKQFNNETLFAILLECYNVRVGDTTGLISIPVYVEHYLQPKHNIPLQIVRANEETGRIRKDFFVEDGASDTLLVIHAQETLAKYKVDEDGDEYFYARNKEGKKLKHGLVAIILPSDRYESGYFSIRGLRNGVGDIHAEPNVDQLLRHLAQITQANPL